MDDRIKKFICKVRARLREQEIILSLLYAGEAGLLVAVLLSVFSLVVPFYYAVPFSVGVIVFSFLAGIAIGIYKTPALTVAALKADAKGHKEKISTAFFLSGKEDGFSILQKKDTLSIIEGFQVRKEFPIRLPVKHVLVLTGLAIVFTITSLFDTPARDMADVRHDIIKEAKEDIARLEKVEKKIEEHKEIQSEEVAGIKKQIEAAKRELSEAGSREELKKAEERIAKKLEMAGEKAENKTLGEIMNEAAMQEKEAAKKKEEDLQEKVKKALAKAEKGSRKDKQEAYKELKKLAETMGEDELLHAAEEYKDSGYSDSDYAQAQSALEKALSQRAAAQSDMAENSQSNNPHTNGQESGNKDNGNNQESSLSDSQNSEGGNNQSNGQNGNEKGKNGQGSSGQNGNGNGSGNGSGSGNGTGGGWNRGSKDGKEGAGKTDESITVPESEIGDDENLTGKTNGNNSGTKEKSSQSKAWSGNKVSYGEVSGKYKEKAYKRVNGSDYPGKLKDKIKNYFEGLN